MYRNETAHGAQAPSRDTAKPIGNHIGWVDYAKGICILLVVMMHSTLGVGEAFGEKGLGSHGFMHWVVAYAKPFRMPDFFLLAGLVLSLSIARDWQGYFDKKVVHFAYFYLVWVAIQAPIKTAATSGLSVEGLVTQFLDALVNPYPTLWFIYVLPLFFVAAKLLRPVPAWLQLAAAAALKIAPVHTGWSAIDHFAAPYLVFFLAGTLLAPYIFALAAWAARHTSKSLALIAAWAILNGFLVFTPSPFKASATLADLPLVSIALGGMGALAVVMIASLLAKFDLASALRYCGRNSLAIYVAFAIPMAFSRVVMLKTGIVTDVGVASAIVWLTALASPLILHALVRSSVLRHLFVRPQWFVLPSFSALQATGMPPILSGSSKA